LNEVKQEYSSHLPDTKKIGEYLIEHDACTSEQLSNALQRQKEFKEKGYNILLGSLLVDATAISKSELAYFIKLQDTERLGASLLFVHLEKDVVADVFKKSATKNFSHGEIIFQQNDASDNVNVILSGSVALTHRSIQGVEIDIAVMRSGESFGDMSVLSESPRTVTARAMEQCKLICIPAEIYKKLYHKYIQFSKAAIKKWSGTVLDGKVSSQAYQNLHYHELLSKKETLPCFHLTGGSRHADSLRQMFANAAASDNPILLQGVTGSLKNRAAQQIHDSKFGSSAPFIVFSTENIPAFISSSLFENIDSNFDLELTQLGALFGYNVSQFTSPGHAPWQGFIKLAHGGTLVIENIDKLEAKVQRLLAEYIQTGRLISLDKNKPTHAHTRVIATATDDLAITKELYNCFVTEQIQLPPLSKRKKDIVDIVTQLINEFSRENNKTIYGIDPEAMNMIVAYDWPGDFQELESVIFRAVNLSSDSVVTQDEIFIDKAPISGKVAFNLLNIKLIRNFFVSPFYPKVLQLFVTFNFLLIIFLGLFGAASADANITLLLVWANWEPLLLLSCLVLARIWCSVCPIGFIAGFFMKIPFNRYRVNHKYFSLGFMVSGAGMMLIFWSQETFAMLGNPANTSLFLLVILSFAIVFALFFEDKIWCRFVCPLGQMVAIFSRTSMIEVRSNNTYCQNGCQTYECFFGRGDLAGCSMAKGPFAMETNHDCVLCGNCMKVCTNESVRLNLRPPGWELWNAKAADIAAIILVPAIWGTQLFRGVVQTINIDRLVELIGSRGGAYALVGIAALLAAYIFSYFGSVLLRVLKGVAIREDTSETVYVLAMLPLIFANEIALRLPPLFNQAADFFIILSNQFGYDFPKIAFRLDLESIQILQVLLIVVGLFIAIFVTNRLIKPIENNKSPLKRILYLPLFIVAIISFYLL